MCLKLIDQGDYSFSDDVKIADNVVGRKIKRLFGEGKDVSK